MEFFKQLVRLLVNLRIIFLDLFLKWVKEYQLLTDTKTWSFSSFSQSAKTQYVHFRLRTNYTFFHLGRFVKKLVDVQCSSINKGSTKHVRVHTTFYTRVDWPEIGCFHV